MRVLFLGGLGRSGTTLLERLLGEIPQICPLGEVVHLWRRGVLDNEQCGCGHAFRDCSFWQEVGERAFGGWEALDVERVLDMKAAVDRTRFVPELAAPRLRRSAAPRIREYALLYREVYDAVRDLTGCRVVVDSSKHASLAYCLRWCHEVDLRVLHVVRDSRAVAHSWTKQVTRPEGTGEQAYMSRLSPPSAGLRWNTENTAFELLRHRGMPLRRIRYEDVLAAPLDSLGAIVDFAGLPHCTGGFGFVDAHGADLSTQHTVSGNPMRFQTGRVALRRDDAWRAAMPPSTRRTVTALTWPWLAGYGYVGRSTRSR